MHDIERGELRGPACVLDVDLATCDGVSVDVERYASAWCLIRRDGVAVATRFLDVDGDTSLSLADVVDGAAVPDVPPMPDCPDAGLLSVTVVICTRDRRDGLLTTLASLAAQSDSKFEVLVVDNSRDGGVAADLTSFTGLTLRSCHEPAPGLSRARNRGLAEVESDVIAWIDDDEVADRDWMTWMKRGFAASSRPDAVAGVMLPAELETDAQVNFERYGGFNKGRGMLPEILRAGTASAPNPLYPLPNFGAGGNMAFRTSALRAIGGFNTRLGAGTLTHGGEETLALSLLLRDGATVLHWPPAVTWHYHRRTDEALEKQFFGYSAGLTAFYMSTLHASPRSIFRILGIVPSGMRRMLANRTTGVQGGPPAGFPDHLLRAGRRGLLEGAWLYVREARIQRAARNACE